jgi:hypothetical protein
MKGVKLIIYIFAFIGIIITSIILHEISHMQDFKEITPGGKIIVLEYYLNQSNSFDGNRLHLGVYENGRLKKADEAEFKRIKEFTEYKAYAIESLFLLFVLFIIFIDIFGTKKKHLYFFSIISSVFLFGILGLANSSMDNPLPIIKFIRIGLIVLFVFSIIKFRQFSKDDQKDKLLHN